VPLRVVIEKIILQGFDDYYGKLLNKKNNFPIDGFSQKFQIDVIPY